MSILVSVIVPIYNVYPYLDRCIESIVNQTYTNIEILLINDGSTDQSLDKCLEWRKKDDRIIVIDKKNEKLGPTRNYGIQIARGEYITAIDSDDWVDKRYIECFIYNALKYGADMVIGDALRYFQKDNSMYASMNAKAFSVYDTTEKKIMLMKNRPFASFCAKLYKKSMLIQNHICQPPTSAQDIAVLIQCIACSEIIVTIPDQLYNYWMDRDNSTINTIDRSEDFIKVFEQSVQDMKRLELFSKYREGQLAFLMRIASIMLKNCSSVEKRNFLSSRYEELFNNTFPGWQSEVGMKWVVYGSFNAKWVAQQISHSQICTPVHICFTGLISQFMGETNRDYIVVHPNITREKALRADILGGMTNLKITDEVGILIDFLNECNDVVITDEDVYITKSEAFEESSLKEMKVKRIIKFGTEEFMCLWKNACKKFVSFLEELNVQVPIYLLKMRLAKGYGRFSCEELFANQDEIELINDKLSEMESFFCSSYNKVIYIEGEDELFFARTGYRFGVKPYYLNTYLYEDLAKKIWLRHTTS